MPSIMPSLASKAVGAVTGLVTGVLNRGKRFYKWQKKHKDQALVLYIFILGYSYCNFSFWSYLPQPYGTQWHMQFRYAETQVLKVIWPETWLLFLAHWAALAVLYILLKRTSKELQQRREISTQRQLEAKNIEREERIRKQMQVKLQVLAQQAEEEKRRAQEEAARIREAERLAAREAAEQAKSGKAQAIGSKQAQVAQAAAARSSSPVVAPSTTSAQAAPSADHSAQQKQRYEALQRAADQAAAANSGAGNSSAGSSNGAAGAPSGRDMAAARGAGVAAAQRTGMVPLSVAQEAEERQRQWLQHGGGSTEALARMAREAERAAQDAEYQEALTADQKRAAARAAAEAEKQRKEEEKRALAKKLQELAALKQQLKGELEPEPAEDEKEAAEAEAAADGGTAPPSRCVVVRVRLPDGSTHTRRWLRSSPMDKVYCWVQSIDAMPLWAPEQWRLATSYPRTVVERSAGLVDVAGPGHGLMLLVEQA
uniref:UBX domain-containing protein n=1 Tax=Chlamydomonas leiostraca TaxID=1034604 RepID=A0A7S0RXK8_9CHLO